MITSTRSSTQPTTPFEIDPVFERFEPLIYDIMHDKNFPQGATKTTGIRGIDYIHSPTRSAALGFVATTAYNLSAVSHPFIARKINKEGPEEDVFYVGNPNDPRIDTITPILVQSDRRLLPISDENNSYHHLLKYRSMLSGSDKLHRVGQKAEQSCPDRITRVGRTLRKTKLDELPQLLSVLSSDRLELIGPRPMLQSELLSEAMLEVFAGDLQAYNRYLRDVYNPTINGLVGLPSVMGIGEEFRKQEDFEHRVALDIIYANTASAAMDYHIIKDTTRHIGGALVDQFLKNKPKKNELSSWQVI